MLVIPLTCKQLCIIGYCFSWVVTILGIIFYVWPVIMFGFFVVSLGSVVAIANYYVDHDFPIKCKCDSIEEDKS